MKRFYLLPLIAAPVLALLGYFAFADAQYTLISVCIAVAALIPFFISGEAALSDLRTLLLVAVFTAFSVCGRFLFVQYPAFKPMAAFAIIAGAYLGSASGFMTGALSALISNLWFGQGPWTPFQMLALGVCGFLAGILHVGKGRIRIGIYGVFAGLIYSLITDIWTVLSMYGGFSLSAYLAASASSLPFTGIYALSNLIFLELLAIPIGKKISRIHIKYGMREI